MTTDEPVVCMCSLSMYYTQHAHNHTSPILAGTLKSDHIDLLSVRE